ncbi:hypothetical protein TRAPUB_830 [Trametes pubescens]|uniref:Transmembrane protein n=1 Tax=Trametes pubescens TaxID=154538 RepID=A0A1M2VKZ3_TRAPU|nr:hypothetical protein TRAPUB_830 [Trametes pubescens]
MATSAPSLTFAEVPSMSTCGKAIILWTFEGSSQELSLFVANNSATPLFHLPLIASSVLAPAGAYFWDPVNVTSGRYQILAIGTNIASISASFHVSSGPSSSCLHTSLSSPTTGTYTSAVSQQQATSDQSSRTGAIVGGIAGGVVFIVALIGICIYLALRGKAAPGYRWRSFTTAGRAARPAHWSGLSSHVDLSGQNPPSPPVADPIPTVPTVKDSTPLALLPRLEPNRRKPSVSLSALSTAAIPPPTESTQRTAPVVPAIPAILLDKELPHRPTSYAVAATPDRPRRSRTLDATDAASVIWLRRHSSMAPHTRRPSGASAVPSSATSQMYRVRDSMWAASQGSPESRERASPDTWSVHRGTRYHTRTTSMKEVAVDVPPLPSGEV